MSHRRALIFIELLFVVAIFALIIGVLLPAIGAARRTARSMQNSTPIRGIHQGHVLFSQGNNGYYAGMMADGELEPPFAFVPNVSYGCPTEGAFVSIGFAQLLNGNYFTPAYMINPAETNPAIKALTSAGDVTPSCFSYASLQIGDASADAGRRTEWHDNTNTQAAILGDRVLASNMEASGEVDPPIQRSTWTTKDGDWRGGVVFGDNSTQFLTTSTVSKTKYGKTTNTNDNLFQKQGADDALFVCN